MTIIKGVRKQTYNGFMKRMLNFAISTYHTMRNYKTINDICKTAVCLIIYMALTAVVSCSENESTLHHSMDDSNNYYGKTMPCNGNYKGNWRIGQDFAETGMMNVATDRIQITSLPLKQLLSMAAGEEYNADILNPGFETGYMQYGFSESTFYYYITRTDYIFNTTINGRMCIVKILLEDTADNLSQAIYTRDTFVIKLRIKQIDIYGEKNITFSQAVVLTFTGTKV